MSSSVLTRPTFQGTTSNVTNPDSSPISSKLVTGMVVTDSSMMFRNRIINGDMRIDQRGVALANANGYVVDRFSAGYYGGATGRFSAERSGTVPAGFTNSFLLTTTTAQAVLGANDGFAIRQAIEGFNVADLSFGQSNAQTVTVSFWVRSSQTGTFSVLLLNSAGDRCYGALVTVNAVDTFEYKTVTILGDTSGTWLKDNGIGIQLFFGLGAGSSRTVAAGWSSGAGGATPGAVTGQTINICASVGANIRITGVQLEAGPTATPFERRPIGTELSLCQRYYEAISASGFGISSAVYVNNPWKVTKRGTTVLTLGSWSFNAGNTPVTSYSSANTHGFELAGSPASNSAIYAISVAGNSEL